MKIKKGVVLAGLQICMRKALKSADRIWGETGQELVVTSGLEGEHSAGSWHYYGLAVDFRTRYFTDAETEKAAKLLAHELGDRYKVIIESTHIHVARPV